MATIEREWVALTSATSARAGHGPHPCQGLYHRPAGARPTVACIATHYNVDFSEHYLGRAAGRARHRVPRLEHPLPRQRGLLPPRARARRHRRRRALAAGAGRRRHGRDPRQLGRRLADGRLPVAGDRPRRSRPTVGLPLPDAVLDLPPADLYVSLNAHPGRPEVLTAWMDPAVTDETDPLSVDPALDMFDPAHGPPYATGVRRALPSRAGGPQRPHHRVGARRARAPPGGAARGIALFNLHRVWADLRFADLTLDPSDRAAGCYAGDPRGANFGPFAIGGTSTLRSWLSMWSLETSQCRGAPHLGRITVPSLVVQSLADRGVFPSDAHAIHDALAADGQDPRARPRRALLRGHRPRRRSPTSWPPGSRAAPSHLPRRGGQWPRRAPPRALDPAPGRPPGRWRRGCRPSRTGAADRRMKPAATAIGTSTTMLAWMLRRSDTWPISGQEDRRSRGWRTREIVENDAARTRGGATIEMSAKNAGASVPIDAARMKCISDGDPEVRRVGQRDEHEPVDHPDDRDEPQEEARVASWRSWRCEAWRRRRRSPGGARRRRR